MSIINELADIDEVWPKSANKEGLACPVHWYSRVQVFLADDLDRVLEKYTEQEREDFAVEFCGENTLEEQLRFMPRSGTLKLPQFPKHLVDPSEYGIEEGMELGHIGKGLGLFYAGILSLSALAGTAFYHIDACVQDGLLENSAYLLPMGSWLLGGYAIMHMFSSRTHAWGQNRNKVDAMIADIRHAQHLMECTYGGDY